MKKQNYFLLFISAMLFVVTTRCDKETVLGVVPEDEASLVQTLFADDTVARSNVTFVTTGAWISTIKEVAATDSATDNTSSKAATDWLQISPSSGDKAGSYTVAITLEPNYTGADRSVAVTVSSGGTDVTITVTQKATKEDGTLLNPDVPVEGVKMEKNLTIAEGDSATLRVDILPENASNKAVMWFSSNDSVATVNSGVVAGISPGTAEITVTTVDGGFTENCIVTITERQDDTIPVTGIQLQRSFYGSPFYDTIFAEIIPFNATHQEVTWSIDRGNDVIDIWTGDDYLGKKCAAISPLNPGTAVLTATSVEGGFKASCTVTVAKDDDGMPLITDVKMESDQ